MTGELFDRVLVPVVSEEDGRATARAIAPHLAAGDRDAVFVYVVEKAGGAPDAASVEQREEIAEEIFAVVRETLGEQGTTVETHVHYGTDVAETIVAAAHEHGASAIAFTPRGGSRWVKLLAGDVTTALLAESDLPVVVLPDRAADGDT